MLTKKDKLEQFDHLQAEYQKLLLAVHDLKCSTKFPFHVSVRVDCAKEVDGDYPAKYRVSISDRAMPVYMVEGFDEHGSVMSCMFTTEGELMDQRDNHDIYFRMLRHAAWKITRLRSVYPHAA